MIPDFASNYSQMYGNDMLINVFRKMCYTRYFELMVVKNHKEKRIKNPIYLSTGQESIPAALSELLEDYTIFAQHRAHSVYLSFGGNPEKLMNEILGEETGCLGGNGGSPMIQDLSIKMIGHHGLIGENVPLATGYALGTGKNTVCFMGDGSVEEDYIAPSLGFASKHKLPILFVCQDNNLSVLTKVEVRRTWRASAVAHAYNLSSIESSDNPWEIIHYTKTLVKNLPAFMNIRTCRHNWHVGSGVDGVPEFDTLRNTKERLAFLGIAVESIDNEEKAKVEELWQQSFPKLSEK
jgi:acetoin:2,6-dichlorophenolindophenol oxidoreductase subunit alpha